MAIPAAGVHAPRTPPRTAPGGAPHGPSISRTDLNKALGALSPEGQAKAQAILKQHSAGGRVSVPQSEVLKFMQGLDPMDRATLGRIMSSAKVQVPASSRFGAVSESTALVPAKSASRPAAGGATALAKPDASPVPSRPGSVPSRPASGGPPSEMALVPSQRPSSAGSAAKPAGKPDFNPLDELRFMTPGLDIDMPHRPATPPRPERPAPKPTPMPAGGPTMHVTQNIQVNQYHLHFHGPEAGPGKARPQDVPAPAPNGPKPGGEGPSALHGNNPAALPPAVKPEVKPDPVKTDHGPSVAESPAGEGKKGWSMGAKIGAGVAALVAAFPILAIFGAKTSPSDTSAGTPGNGM